MSTFTIESVGDPREWSSQKHGGRFFAYPLDLKDEEGVMHFGVEWSRKADTRSPQPGKRIVGAIETGQHGDKLKVDYDATRELGSAPGGGGGSRPSSKSRRWKPESQFDPEKTARIGRAHAQGMAVRVLVANGLPAGAGNTATARAAIKDWTDWFEADVNNAAQKAAQGAVPAVREGAPAGGASRTAPAQTPDIEDTHWRIESLLEESGINSAAARLMAGYATEHMSEAEQSAVIERLQNVNMRQAAIERLTERTEAHHGEPLPTSASGVGSDDIPFARPEYREPFSERERKSRRP